MSDAPDITKAEGHGAAAPRAHRRYLAVLACLTPLLMVAILLHDLLAKQHEVLVRIVDTLSARDVGVLYFGDSVIRMGGVRDERRDVISALLAQKGGYDVLPADSAAFSAILYQNWLPIIARQKHKPKVVIIPLNMRSFSGAWFTRPEYRFELDRVRSRIRYLSASPRALLDYLDCRFTGRIAREKEEWRNREVVYGDLNLGKRTELDAKALINCHTPLEYLDSHDFGDQLAVQFGYHYMNVVTPSHGMFACLDRAIAVATSRGCAVVCYVSPMNHEDGARFVGDRFSRRVRANVAVICDYMRNKPVTFVNLAFALDAGYFVDKRTTSEHLDFAGRDYVATRLHAVIQDRGLVK